MKIALPVAALLASLTLSACVVAPASPYYGDGVYVAPPPARVEYVGPPPVVGQVWINGYWNWGGNRHVWVPGRWEAPPRPGYNWVPHRWDRQNNGWQLRGGHWDHGGGRGWGGGWR